MERDNLFKNEANTLPPVWVSSKVGMELQSNELSYTSDQLTNCFFNPNWDNSVEQNDPFESALSSMVSSPVASSANDNVVLRELIGKLGNICSSGEISPQSYVNSNNNSCYSTPLNSPPKLGRSLMDHQIRGKLPIPGIQLSVHPPPAPFSSDPKFARFPCSAGSITGQLGLSESELPLRWADRMDNGWLSPSSGNQSPLGGQEDKDYGLLHDGMSISDKKSCRLSRCSTPENAENSDSREGSSISEQIQGGEIGIKIQTDTTSRKRKLPPRGRVKEVPPSTSVGCTKAAEENKEPISKRSKPVEANETGKDVSKANGEVNGSGKAAKDGNQKQTKDNQKPPEPPKDYIHVRARRGQATDSHSIAERVRREKISQRMKFLQDLVPGCNKVTGKAVMLDEIINYVQSLQRQVEFLSMKLATINPRMEFSMGTILSKDIMHSAGCFSHNVYNGDELAQTFPYAFQPHQGTNLHAAVTNRTDAPFCINPLNGMIHRNPSMQVAPVDDLGEAASQAQRFQESDLQSIVQMGFGQNDSHNFHGAVPATKMKVEL